MLRYLRLSPLCILFLPAIAIAADPSETSPLDGGPLGYAAFEVSVDHVDLANCPDGLDPEQVFCRMTLASERANVFVFSHEGDQRLVEIRHYELEDGFLAFGGKG